MKIPDNYIKELVQGIAGEKGVNLVFLIKDKQNVSEFKIAEKMNITVNEVRNVLYRLQDRNLVFFTRKKDKKKGWYIYFWTFDMPKARDLMLEIKQEKKQFLHKTLKEEKQGNVYTCPNKDPVRFNAEVALEHQFRCPECDAVLVEENVEKRSEKIKKELETLHLEIDELSKIQKPLPKIEPEKKVPKKKEIGKKAIPPPKIRVGTKHHIQPKEKMKPKKHTPKPQPKKVHKAKVIAQPKIIHKPVIQPKPSPPVVQEKKGFFGSIKNKFSRK